MKTKNEIIKMHARVQGEYDVTKMASACDRERARSLARIERFINRDSDDFITEAS